MEVDNVVVPNPQVFARGRGGRRGGRSGASRGVIHTGNREVVVDAVLAEEILAEEVEPVPIPGGRGRGGASVSRRGQTAARRPTRPTAVDQLQLMDINALPRGTPLENPLNPRKRRAWNPLNPSPAPGVVVENPSPAPSVVVENPSPAPSVVVENPSPAPDAMVEMEVEVEVEAIDVAPGPSSPSMPPSPALFVECGGSGASTPRSHNPVRQNLRRPLRDVDIELQLNYGSESDDDSDQDEVPQQQMSRVFQGSLDTPVGEEEVVGAVPGYGLVDAFIQQWMTIDFGA
ncbi:hypothetical protein O0L34_g19414 [Tuta absoluta]|nr:hypothetical protein O0L34_g19414 [Tuta absoluta]